jgi:hypothetical protein
VTRWLGGSLDVADRILDVRALDLDGDGRRELVILGAERIQIGVVPREGRIRFSDLRSRHRWQEMQRYRASYGLIRLFPASVTERGEEALFGIGPDGLVALTRDGDLTMVARQWGVYPDKNVWRFHVAGDFTGDGLSDLASRSEVGAAWWVVVGGEETGLERSVYDDFSASAVPPSTWRKLDSADLDDDGIDEILLLADAPPALHVLRAELAREMASSTRPSTTGPFPCTGYAALPMPRWGDMLLMKFAYANECAEDHAFFASSDGSGRGIFFPIDGACCRLPADDILLDRHVDITEHYPSKKAICPDDHVLTMLHFDFRGGETVYRIRCTALNARRYQLGTRREGLYWGVGRSGGSHEIGVQREQVPVALRHSLGREDADYWDGDGCVGYPWGSVLVERRGPKCKGLIFRQIQYRGLPGDPPQGTPVLTLPDCSAVDGLFSPDPRCLAGGEAPIDHR